MLQLIGNCGFVVTVYNVTLVHFDFFLFEMDILVFLLCGRYCYYLIERLKHFWLHPYCFTSSIFHFFNVVWYWLIHRGSIFSSIQQCKTKVKKVTVLFMCKFWGTVSVHLILMEFDDIFYEIMSLIETKIIQKIFKLITLSFKMFSCIFRFSWTLLIELQLLQPKKLLFLAFSNFFVIFEDLMTTPIEVGQLWTIFFIPKFYCLSNNI